VHDTPTGKAEPSQPAPNHWLRPAAPAGVRRVKQTHLQFHVPATYAPMPARRRMVHYCGTCDPGPTAPAWL